MNKMVKYAVFLTLLVYFLGNGLIYAQIPSDLTKIRSAQITDAQLMQFIQQAQSSDMSEAEMMAEFQKKGLPEAEIQALAARIKGLSPGTVANKEPNNPETPATKRQYKGETNASNAKAVPSKVFGSELFSSADPLFVPNLKIATPKTYIIGPDDELQLDIYGNNISSQKLVVSPDGMVSVKYAGQVNLSGLSIGQATGILKARLLKFYPSLGNGSTQLQLTLGSMRSIQVMVIGAVKKPGTITLPSIATLFNALYASGGPADNGSFRNIELVRDNKILSVADLYDFILKGDQSSNLSLRDNDVIRVPFAKIQVNLEGALNRTGVFEVKSTESLQKALDFAGGFLSNAFKGRITGSRYTDTERKVIDVAKEEFSNFALQNGDLLSVNAVVEKYENRVLVTGAVSKPGAYSLDKNLNVKSLVAKAQGLAEGAFASRASLIRIKPDQSKEFFDIDLRKHLSGEQSIQLEKEDSLHVYFEQELKDKPTVFVSGAVRKSGEFVYEDSLTLQGLILKAGGLSENALVTNIEIGRRKKGVDQNQLNAEIAEIITVKLDKQLNKVFDDILLAPYDEVSVRIDPEVVPQKKISASGMVLLPGSYTMQSNADLLSSLVNRCGGLLPNADATAAKLIRRNRGVGVMDVARVARANTKNDSTAVDEDEVQELSKSSVEIAIDLKAAILSPGSKDDILLEEGDEMYIPKMNYVVTVSGEVQKIIAVQYNSSFDLKDYIDQAGGYSYNANRRRIFVIYANGKSGTVKHPLGIFRINPKITPGSTVFVPKKPEVQKKVFDAAKAGILVSAFSAAMTGLVLLFR
jgi:protein involved in polysaccharide export with SLBB domain